jgi:tetratricopeptide (TPR) repeat protein
MALSPKLASAGESSPDRPETRNLEAYDLVLRAIPLINEVRKEPMAIAQQMLQKAIALDPNYARAYAMLTWFYFNDWVFEWTPDHARGLDQAIEVAKKSVAMDESLSDAHVALGWTLLWKKQHDLAAAEMEKAVALDPNNYDAYALYAQVLNFCGRPEEAIAAAKKARRLDPNFPFYVTFSLGNSYYLLRRYDEAIAAYQEVVRRNPGFPPAHGQLAMIYTELGREKEARAEAAEAQRLDPITTAESLRNKLPYKNKADLDRIVSSARAAGLR